MCVTILDACFEEFLKREQQGEAIDENFSNYKDDYKVAMYKYSEKCFQEELDGDLI